MAIDRIVYEIDCSLDGYMETVDHSLDWASVDDELHAWSPGQVPGASTLLDGTRMYQTMAAYWPTAESDPAPTPVMRDHARAWNSGAPSWT